MLTNSKLYRDIKGLVLIQLCIISVFLMNIISCVASDNFDDKKEIDAKTCITKDDKLTIDEKNEILRLLNKLCLNLQDPVLRKNISKETYDETCQFFKLSSTISNNLNYHPPYSAMSDNLNTYIRLYKKEEKSNFIEEKINIKYCSIKKYDKTATEQNYQKLFGKVVAYFSETVPIYSTGVLIDQHHVLTLASNLTYKDKDLQSLAFISYDFERENYTYRIEVDSVIFPAAFGQFSEKADHYNFALLRIAVSLPLLNDQTFLFTNLQNPLQYLTKIYGFDGYYNDLKTFSIDSIQKEDNYFKYKAETSLGSSGAPLVIKKDTSYYILGLHTIF